VTHPLLELALPYKTDYQFPQSFLGTPSGEPPMYFFVGVPDRITFQSWLEPPLGYITDYQFSQSSLVTLPGVFESFAVVEVRCTAVFIGVGCLNVSTLNHDMERPNIVLLI